MSRNEPTPPTYPLPDIKIHLISSNIQSIDISSLESILAQDYRGKIQITIQVEKDCKYSDAFSQIPWLSGIHVTEKISNIELQNWHITLQAGNGLHPTAVRQMVCAIQESNADLACAAVRYFEGKNRWTKRSSLNFFNLPSIVPFSPFLDHYIHSGEGIALFKRARAKKNQRCVIVHEYLSQRKAVSDLDNDRVLCAKKTPFFTWEKPAVYIKNKRKKNAYNGKSLVWLFGERAGQSAEENSWILFDFCQKKYPSVESYYVLNADANVSKEVKAHSCTIHKGDKKWKALLPRATHLFFNDSAMDILQDRSQLPLVSSAEKIFLTHGVLYFYSGIYARKHRYFDKICVGLDADKFYGARDWKYPLGLFYSTGLPRWDRLPQAHSPKKEILLCPTWRKRLDKKMWKKWNPEHQDFKKVLENDPFVNLCLSFLKSPRLLAFLEKNDLTLTVAAHFRLRFLFETLHGKLSSRIQFDDKHRSIQQLLIDSSLLITDYSSIMWDMAYMKKPVICCQSDKPLKLIENNLEHFNLGDHDYFADVCYSQNEIFTALEKYSAQNFSLSEKQKIELASLFPPHGNHCQKVMDAVLTLSSRPEAQSRSFSFPLHDKRLSELCSNKKVACIGNPTLFDSLPVYFLSPDTWQTELAKEKPDILLFQPHLNATAPWSEYFFSLSSTQDLINNLESVTKRLGISTYYIDYPFQYPHAYLKKAKTFHTFHQKSISVPEAYEISVIIPVYNGEKYLTDCVQSVLDQIFNGTVEIILVNDGSTDSSEQLIHKIMAENPNIKYIQQPNMRQGVARNHALQIAQGKYVTFLDADDRLAPDALASLHSTILKHSTPIAIGQVCSVNISKQRQWINQSGYHYLKAPELISAERWPSVFLDPSAVGKLYRRDFLIKNNLFFSQSYWEDGFFCVSLFLTAQEIAVCHTIVYEYVGRPAIGRESGTQTFSKNKLSQILRVSSLCIELAEKKPKKQKDMIIRLMIIRVDRFLFKFISNGNILPPECYSLLHNLLKQLPSTSIDSYTKYCKKLFEHVSASKNCVEELTPDILEHQKHSIHYDYFIPYALPTTGKRHIFSFKYELGLLFVNIAKKNIGAKSNFLKNFSQLMYYFVKYKMLGMKDFKRKQANNYDCQTIQNTAAYRLGNLLVESFRTPWKLLMLPQKIQSLWSEYK